MKHCSLVFIFFTLLFVSNKLMAQASLQDIYYNNAINVNDVILQANKHFDTTNKNTKGSGYKQFQRWRYATESKFAPEGDRSNVSPLFAIEQYQLFITNNKKTRGIHNGWQELGPKYIDTITGHYAAGLGRVEDFYVKPSNPNIIYLGSRSGGFWRSTNGGTTWQGTTDTLVASGVNAIAVSPTNSDSVLINCNNARNNYSHGIYRSINGGTTWTITNFNPTQLGLGGLGSNFEIYTIKYHPLNANIVFVGTDEGLYKSTNSLNTWTQVLTTGNITNIDFHPTNANIMYVYDNTSGGSFENNVLTSTNGGNTFTASTVLSGNNNARVFLSTTPACNHCVYAGSANGIWLSKDSGKTFILKGNIGTNLRSIAVNTFDTSKIVSGYVDLFNSTTGGASNNQCTWWSLGSSQHGGGSFQNAYNISGSYVHADCNILKCINGVYYAGTDGFIAKSSNNGDNWTIVSEGTGIRENYCLGTSQSNHYITYCGSQDNGESIKKQNGWYEFYGADGMEGFFHPLNDNWMIGSGQYGFRRRTKDGGYSQDGVTPPVDDAAWVSPIAYSPNHQMKVYDFTDSVMCSNNFGSDWQYLSKPFNTNINCAAVAENNDNILVVSTASSIRKSVDGGLTWVSIKGTLPNYTITDIAFSPVNDNIITVTYDRYQTDNQKIFITKDGGTTWSNITYNLGSMPLRSVVIDHTPLQNIYAGAEIGVFVKAMNDTVWTLYNSGLPNVTANELEINYGSNTLKAATWGRGLWETNLVGRQNYPAIVNTSITNPPTEEFPRIGFHQHITSKISYTGTLTSVFVKWGKDTTFLNNTIVMNNVSDSTWKTIDEIKSLDTNNIYFKVYAVGSANDTSETYRFNYFINPNVYCVASGYNDGGNLHIKNVTVHTINNSTANETYTYNDAPIIDLYPNTNYTIDVTASSNWSNNDFAAWIDFDGNKIFDDPAERILYAIDSGSNASAVFNLPNTFNTTDTFRLRVRLAYWDDNPQPCGTTLGEVEDYTVKMHWPTNIGGVKREVISSYYPNPANQQFYIKTNQKIAKSDIKVINIIGQTEEVSINMIDNYNFSININNLGMGTYTIKVKNEAIKVNVIR
jgi:hypothetical protein